MQTVASIWRVAALMIPLTSMVGCDWVPVRRRIDPSLYPVPARPDATLIRGDRKASPPPPGPGAGDPAALVADARQLPPLPDLVPVSPEELFPPDPTPMLDAALVRAQAVREAVFEDEPPAPLGAEADAIPVPIDGWDIEPVPEVPLPAPEAVEVPPIPETIPEDLTEVGAFGPEPLRPDDPSGAGSIALDVPPPPEPTATPRGEEPVDRASTPLKQFLDDVRESLAEEGDDPATREARRHLLDRLAEIEAEAEARGQAADDPDLWQMVMRLLADLEPEAPGLSGDDPGAGGHSLRVARVAFCREVLGFDRIRPFEADAFQTGQDVLVYCELEGVCYALEQDRHVSRLASTLELLGEDDEDEAPARWSITLPVEDHCTRPRRDYFAGYRLTIPEGLDPGSYRLRVSQRDELSGHGAAAEVPLVIGPRRP